MYEDTESEDEYDIVIEQIKRIKAKTYGLGDQIAGYKREIERLKEIDRWRSMNVGVAELNRVKKERDAIKYSEKRVLKELEVANQTIDALTEKNTELENELQNAYDDIADMHQDHAELVKKNRYLKNDVENLVELSQKEEDKRDYKDFEIQALKAEIEHYKNTNKKLPNHISVDIDRIDHIARDFYSMDESKKLVQGVIGVRWEFLPAKIRAEYREKATKLVYLMLTHITKGE